MLHEEQSGRLDALAAAYRELGSTPEEAMAEAAAHLRRSQGETWTHRVERKVACRPFASALPATLMALGLFGCFYLADVTHVAGRWWEAHYADRDSDVIFYRLEALLVPMLAGLTVGLLARAKAARGTFYALAILAISAIWIPAIFFALQVTNIGFFGEGFYSRWPFLNPQPGLVGLAFWPALGCLGAAVGGWLRRRRRG